MTTQTSLPSIALSSAVLPGIPHLAFASPKHLITYAALAVQMVKTRDGLIGDARAQLILLNELAKGDIPGHAEVEHFRLSSLLHILENLRAGILPLCLHYPAIGIVEDDAGRMLCALDALIELARRSVTRASAELCEALSVRPSPAALSHLN